jgi:hypothetical protein
LSKTLVLDCYANAKANKCKASMANDARNTDFIAGNKIPRNNTRLSVHAASRKAKLVTINSLQKDEEILYSYSTGGTYFGHK